MNAQKKGVSLLVEAPYYTLGELDVATEHVWIICHGIGQRAKYFLKKFPPFPVGKHYVIAPQGLSRYYLSPAYDKVGASWMTREYREEEISNQGRYLDQVLETELGALPWERYKFNILGFSQGVATVSRWGY